MTNEHTVQEIRENSERGLTKAREVVGASLADHTGIIVGVNGSYARREVTQGSDLDFFILCDKSDERAMETKQLVQRALAAENFKLPSPGGVFEEPLETTVLTENIGGAIDSNVTITRRMLLLLEGDWLFNKEAFDVARRQVLAAYVLDDTPSEHICLFLLNDIIRYWRTMCVDYQHKARNDKAKAIRLVKLRFSRMLLYFGGVVAVAERGT